MTTELQTPAEHKHLIPTYCEYINKYILQTAKHGKKAVPGEHHFVALYLVPRLAGFSFLGVPHYVNPDGMKASAGDVVYYSYAPEKKTYCVPTPRLRIEVKLVNPLESTFELTRLQYYHWIKKEHKPEDMGKSNLTVQPEQPDIFVGVSKQGVVILPWATFRETFIQVVYPDGLVEIPLIKGRPSSTGNFPMSRFDWPKGTPSPFYFSYSKKVDEWPQLELSLMASLENQCRALTSASPMTALEVRPDA